MICAKPGCPDPATDHGRCAMHRPEVVGTGSRGSGRGWRKLRAQALERDGHRCTHRTESGHRCGATEELAIHHIILVRDGGDDSLGNLTTLCRAHHEQAHTTQTT